MPHAEERQPDRGAAPETIDLGRMRYADALAIQRQRNQAVIDGDDYVINGGKMWTTNGTQADWCCLLVNTEGGELTSKIAPSDDASDSWPLFDTSTRTE